MITLRRFIFCFTLTFFLNSSSYSLELGEEEDLNTDYQANNTITALSIDGGGIRGILPALILTDIQKRIDLRYPNEENPLINLFDITGGTSTGGLITLALNRPSETDPTLPYFTPREIVKKYEKHGPRIFSPQMKRRLSFSGILCPRYNSKNLEAFLDSCCGRYELSQSLSHLVVPYYDVNKEEGTYFSSRKASDDPSYNYLARSVGLSTTAAPTYFEAHSSESLGGGKMTAVDGGVVNNNPSASILATAREEDSNKRIFMLSIGTGCPIKDGKKRSSSLPLVSRSIEEITKILDMFMVDQPNVKEQEVSRFMGSKGYSYYRIQFALPAELMAMDNGNVENIKALKKFGKNYILQNDALLQEITDKLIDLRLNVNLQ